MRCLVYQSYFFARSLQLALTSFILVTYKSSMIYLLTTSPVEFVHKSIYRKFITYCKL